MRFRNIYLPKEISKTKGLEEINLKRLSEVVAFVGKNGSGKSRILDLIEEKLFESLTVKEIFNESVVGLPKSIETQKKQLAPFLNYIITTEDIKQKSEELKKNPNDLNLVLELQNLNNNLRTNPTHVSNKNQINAQIQHLNTQLSNLKKNHLRRIKNSEIRELQQAISESKNDTTLAFETLFENIEKNVNYDELKSINKSALKFLSKLPHQLAFDKYDCLANSKNIEDRISYKRFLSLKKLIKDFLHKELTWEQQVSDGKLTETGNNVTFTGVWKLEGRDFNYSEFSDGEKSLFAYALLFFLLEQNPKLEIKESVIIIDEPELHLHPDSEIDLIEGIRNAIGENGQLIIATHSLNILSHLNYDEIFMVKQGLIKHPSQSTPGESLVELMSIEERLEKLSDFLESISNWSYVNFMAECFSNPEVIVSSRPNDPQVEALKKTILLNKSKNNSILLDFGAGKGRLYEQLKLDYDFINQISYNALEPEISFHERLKYLGAENIYKNHEDLPNNLFDAVVLCNVLHEINVENWASTINKIIKSIKNEGFLIIIEAKTLTKGEKIGTIGYILLAEEEIKELFNLSEIPSNLKINQSENKITCITIPKSNLKEISNSDVKNCLIALKNNTFDKLETLRKNNFEKSSISFGRQSAFLSTQYINAELGIRFLESKK